MKKILVAIAVIFILLPNSQAQNKKHRLVQMWETDTLLKVPESVLYDEANSVLYASNIDGTDPWGKDGKGSIAKIGMDGKIIAVDWVPGLDAPKGMGLYKGKLYVADITHIVVIDTKKGAIEKTIPVKGAEGLNDVSVDSKGVVWVSDSKAKRIYKVENGKSSMFLDSLKGPNGVLMRGSDFFILDDGGVYKVNGDKSLTMISNGMEGGTDGIENVIDNDFIVSCWQGAIWYVHADGTKELLLDTKAQKRNTADIGFDPITKTIYVPTFWKNSVVAYIVSED